MAPSKQQVHKARQDLLDSRKEKEKREELRKKKYEVHRDGDAMPRPAAGKKRECDGDGKTPSSKRQKPERGVLQAKSVARRAVGSSFFDGIQKTGVKAMRSQATVRTVRPGSTSRQEETRKAVPDVKKRKAGDEAAAGQQTEKKRKVTGEGGTAKTSGGKAAGPGLPGTSDSVATASIIASPKDGHIEDQKPAELSKDTAPAEESSVSVDASKDTASAEESSASLAASKDTASAEESSASLAASKDTASAAESSGSLDPSKDTASAAESSGSLDPSKDTASAAESSGSTDKGKAAGPELCGTSKKRSATGAGLTEESEVKKTRRVPVGLFNHHRACFVNAVTQCLQGTAPMDGYYRRQAGGVLASVANCGVTEGDLRKMRGSKTRQIDSRKRLVRSAFQQAVANVSLSAYFGELCDRMSTTTEPSTSPFIFQQAFGSQFTNDDGKPLNGDDPEDSDEFLTKLLGRLKEEELRGRATGTDGPTVVEKTFGVKTTKKVTCKACKHEHYSNTDLLCLPASIPRQRKPLTLEECFSSFEDRNQPSGYKCGECGKADSTELAASIVETQDHLILNIARVDLQGKNPTKISIPQEPIDLGAWFLASESHDTKFEVYGVVRHHGSKRSDGHYDAMVKIEGQWWHLDDDKVSRVDDVVFMKPQTGCQLFLRKVSS